MGTTTRRKRGRPRGGFWVEGEVLDDENALGAAPNNPSDALTPEERSRRFAAVLGEIIQRQVLRARAEFVGDAECRVESVGISGEQSVQLTPVEGK
ncbi:hypothetical protein GC173_16620 [bacterium]|nr:hypothetical protein [bacterium]